MPISGIFPQFVHNHFSPIFATHFKKVFKGESMSIIQSLRERAAWIISGAIAFALIVFVVEEGLRNKSIFGDSNTTLGKVNGKAIDRVEFEEKMKNIEDRYTRTYGAPMDEATRSQQRDALWNEYVEDAVTKKIYDEVGLEVTDKEIGDYLYGDNPPGDFRQRFTDPKTQQFDAQAAYQTVQSIKKQKTSADFKSFFGEYIPALVKFRKREKFESMINGSVYAPKWLVEKMSTENSQMAAISYVNVPYTSIPDSSIKVSDAEINEFVSKHKQAFKQEKASGIDYVSFSAAPSKADSAAIYTQLSNLADTFSKTTDNVSFLLNENSQSPFYDSYISRKEIKIANIDSIVKNPTGSVYGPYLDGRSYVLAKVISSRVIPDTVKVRHILVATVQQEQNGQMVPIRRDEDAKQLADSLALAIKNGSNFDSLCAKFSDDGTKSTGGIYDGVVSARMVAAFNDYIFTNSVGSKGVVKTEFGYHYVEILSQKGSSNAYKIAYLSRPILTSDETANGAMGLATQFAAESRTKAQFEENAKKRNFNVFNAAEIKPLATSITGINGNCRELVRWIFNDAKVGDVSERPFFIGETYIVPVITQAYEEGVMNADRARPTTEYRIRQQKKAAVVSQKAGNATSLDEISKLVGFPVFKADSLVFVNANIPNVGYESKVVGAAFNKANQAKASAAIVGESGIFFIKTESVGAVPNQGMDVKGQQEMQRRQLRMQMSPNQFNGNVSGVMENLKKTASITDNRYKYF